MTPLQLFLVQFELYQGSRSLTLAKSAVDDEVKKVLKIENNHGRFLGTTIRVIPDVNLDGD